MNIHQYSLYCGSYAASHEAGIRAFTFDALSGNLSASWSLSGITNPSFLALHPHGRWLYAVSATSQQQDDKAGEVWSLRLPDQESEPRLLNSQASGGDGPCHLVIDATGRWLLVSNYGSGTLGVFPLLTDGTLGAMTDRIQHHGSGPHPERQQGPHVHSAIFTPDNRFAIVADLGIDQLVIYAFNPARGQLHEHAHITTAPGSGPRHLAFHPSGQYLYVAHELDNTVAVYAYDDVRGGLNMRQVIGTLPSGVSENTVADLHFAPAGNRVYVSNRGHDSIAIFASTADGRLERIAIEPCGGHWPRNFAILPDGRFLLVANQYSNEVTALPVSNDTNALREPCAQVRLPGASCVLVATYF